MSKVITFSRVFPSYHPKAGQPTHFVEKILGSLGWSNAVYLGELNPTIEVPLLQMICDEIDDTNLKAPKHHTIRQGHRWKVGDKFSPRVWSGKPYNSKQIIISADIEIKRIWDIRIWREDKLNWRIYIQDQNISAPNITELAKNDGLSHRDLLDWFNVPIEKNFEGQIICWNDKIEY